MTPQHSAFTSVMSTPEGRSMAEKSGSWIGERLQAAGRRVGEVASAAWERRRGIGKMALVGAFVAPTLLGTYEATKAQDAQAASSARLATAERTFNAQQARADADVSDDVLPQSSPNTLGLQVTQMGDAFNAEFGNLLMAEAALVGTAAAAGGVAWAVRRRQEPAFEPAVASGMPGGLEEIFEDHTAIYA